MATPITGIAINCDFTGNMKLIVFCPYQGAGIDLEATVTRNLISAGTYNAGHLFFYDIQLQAYVKWLDGTYAVGGSQGSPEIDNGTITANLVSNPSETYTVQYQYKSYGYNVGGTTPQGIGVTYQPCVNGMSKVYINSEPKPNDHYSRTRTQAQTAQIILPTAGSVLSPTYIALTAVNDQASEFDWATSNNPNLDSPFNTKDAIWDLGLVSSSQPFTVRVVGYGTNGTDGFATGDYIEETVQVFCSLAGTDGTGTAANQGATSNYTLPEPTSDTGCLPTGLTVLSIATGSTIVVGGIPYGVGSTIPIASLTHTLTNYTGVEEHTTTGTTTGSGIGATFIWESACGQSNQVSVVRTINVGCVAPNISSGFVLPDGATNSPYSHTITYAGTVPLAISSIVKPNWATVSLAGNTVSITGTPLAGDAGTGFVISFNITNGCGNEAFNDTFDITATCVAPAITTQPVGYSICDATPTALSVVATGTATLLYQWYKNAVAISGANSSSYTPSTNGDYKVEITNGCGNVMSNEVTVSISSSPLVATGGTIPDALTLAAYSHNITLSGTAPFAISSIVKPAWMVVSLAGNVVSLSGSPALTDVGTGITVSFTITGSCTPLNFSDTLDVTSTCSAVGGGLINGNALVVNGVSNLFTVTGLTGTAPFTYNWSATNGAIDSGQGTAQAYATFTGNGILSVAVQNCAGLNIVNINFNVTLITADAINDLVGSQITAQQHTLEIDANDVVCNGGATTTYELVAGSEVNVVVNSINPTTGTALYTPIADGAFSFQYAIKCDGTILDGATVSGTAYTPCVNVGGGLISGNTNVIAGVSEIYNLTGLTGTAPYNITWGGTGGVVISTGQGTTTATILRALSGTVTAVVTNCGGLGSVSLTFNVVVITADAVNDAVGNKVTGIATNSQISTNDVVCNVGATTYELVTGSETNVVVNSIDPNTGIANYTPTADGAFSFNYVIKCGGSVLDTATISGTGYTPCVPVSVVITGNKYPVSNGLVTYTASPLIIGTWAITGGAIVQSGQGTGVAQIKYPAVPYIADLTFQYVTCGNTIIIMRKVYMSLPPCCQDCCDSGCC